MWGTPFPKGKGLCDEEAGALRLADSMAGPLWKTPLTSPTPTLQGPGVDVCAGFLAGPLAEMGRANERSVSNDRLVLGTSITQKSL